MFITKKSGEENDVQENEEDYRDGENIKIVKNKLTFLCRWM